MALTAEDDGAGAVSGGSRKDAKMDCGEGHSGEQVSCRVVLRYDSEEVARAVAGSLTPDNEGFITTEVHGPNVEAVAGGKDLMSLAHTLEDLLACAAAAERIASSVGQTENK